MYLNESFFHHISSKYSDSKYNTISFFDILWNIPLKSVYTVFKQEKNDGAFSLNFYKTVSAAVAHD